MVSCAIIFLLSLRWHCSAVVSTVSAQQKKKYQHAFLVDCALFVWSLHALHVPAWISCGSFGFHHQTKQRCVKLTGLFTL